MRVLLTGFGPFPGAPFNPSAILVKALGRRRRPALAEIDRTTHVFATAYAAVDADLPKLLARHPDVILMFGVAGRRRELCVETRACNAVAMLLPDAGRQRPLRGSIALHEPPALKGNAPFAQLLGAVGGAFPARLSRDAGRYLCNYAYWRALHHVRDGRPLVQFVHVPAMRLKPQPLQSARRQAPPMTALVAAAEAILIALIAASRR